ncbi:MAG TPA: autotransporter domain-containing protein [Devosia sp.]|nr:autotransporter domain-containing protein [Devosia sp.]
MARAGQVALAAALLSLASGGAALAAVCSDYLTEGPPMADNIAFDTTVSSGDLIAISTPLSMVAGDQLEIRVTWTRANVGTMSTMRVFGTEPGLVFDTSTVQPNTLSGDVSFGPFTATGSAVAFFSVTAPNVRVTGGEVYITCTPATPGGGGGGGDDSAALDDIRDTIGRRSVFSGAAMLTDLVHAASRGGPGVVSAELDAGVEAWSGIRFDGLLPTIGQWSGGQGVGVAGVTFAPSETWLLGVFAGFEAMAYERTSLGQLLRGSGGTAGANVVVRLTDTWRIEGLVAVSRVDYNAASNGVTGNYQGDRVLGEARLSGDITLGDNLTFVPAFGLLVLNERQGAFTDSASVAHAAIDIGGAEAEVGGTLVFLIPGDTELMLRLGAHARVGTMGASGRLEAGLEATLGEAGTFTLGASASQLGTNQAAVGLQGTLSLQF